MMFLAFALLSGLALFASARPSGVSGRGVTTHKINVSNDSAALLFDPPYIVRQPISLYADRCADRLSLLFRMPTWEISSSLPSIPRTTL